MPDVWNIVSCSGNAAKVVVRLLTPPSFTNLSESESTSEDHEGSPSPHHRHEPAVLVDILRRPGRDTRTHVRTTPNVRPICRVRTNATSEENATSEQMKRQNEMRRS